MPPTPAATLPGAADFANDTNGDEEDQEDEEDDDEPEFVPEVQTMKFGNRQVELLKYRERPRAAEPRRHTVWRRRLEELRTDYRWNSLPAPAPWPVDKQIVYAVNAHQIDATQGLSIELYSRYADKPAAMKSLRMQLNQVNLLPDPLDRQLLGTLVGLAANGNYGYQDIAVPNQLWLRNPSDAAVILRMICQTGRCLLHRRDEDAGDKFEPLQWDEREPWNFNLAVVPDENAKAYRLQGILRRGEERLNISEPRLMAPGGLVVIRDKIAEFHDSGAFRFIHLLLRRAKSANPV